MKNMLTGSNGTHFTTRLLRSAAVLLIVLGMSLAVWTATTPNAVAQSTAGDQDNRFVRMIEAELPQGKTIQNASKNELMAAVCAAIKRNRTSAAQIVRAASEAKPNWKKDILRTAFECVGTGDCNLLGRILRGAISANPGDASDLTEAAVTYAPDCAFGGGDDDEGNFGNAPGNQNPPPGSIGGGGASQGGRCQVCHVTSNGRRQTLTISCNAVPAHLRHGDTEGPCPVTPTQNP